MGIYESDVLIWASRQAELLRRVAAGERINDQVDWENVIEEIESVGNEQVHAVESLLLQAMVHRLKALGWPEARDVPNWLADSRLFGAQAAGRFTPSMRQRLDLPRLFRRARRAIPAAMNGHPPQTLPDDCPWSLEELLEE